MYPKIIYVASRTASIHLQAISSGSPRVQLSGTATQQGLLFLGGSFDLFGPISNYQKLRDELKAIDPEVSLVAYPVIDGQIKVRFQGQVNEPQHPDQVQSKQNRQQSL